MQFIWHSGWDCHILALRSSYNFDLTSGLADPCKIVNCTSELQAANMTVCSSKQSFSSNFNNQIMYEFLNQLMFGR